MTGFPLPRLKPTVKLALLLLIFALLNLAPKKEDCCKNEEEGDEKAHLFTICAEADPAVKTLTLAAGGSGTLHFKQSDCGNANSTFLVPRPWIITASGGLTVTGQSSSGDRIAVTVKATEHPELYEQYSTYEKGGGYLGASLLAHAQPSGLAGLLQGELLTRAAAVYIEILPLPGVDVPWGRSDASQTPAGPRIEIRPVIPYITVVGNESGWVFNVRNRGSANLEIYSVTLEEQGDKWFRLDLMSSQPPWAIPPGEFVDVWLHCKPLYKGTKAATVIVTSNDPKFPIVRSVAKGTGR